MNTGGMTDYDNLLNSALYTREYFLQEDICRICWSKDAGNELFSRMIFCTVKSPLFFKVQSCLDIDLSEDDSEYHPRKICEKCFQKVEQFNEFKVFCQNSNQKLNSILNGTDSKKFKTESKIPKDPVKIEKDEGNAIDLLESLNSFSDSFQNIQPFVENGKEISKENIAKIVAQSSNKPRLNNVQPAKKSNKKNCFKSSLIPNKNGQQFVKTPPKCSSGKVSKLPASNKSRQQLKNKETSDPKRNPYERSPTYCNTCFIDLKEKEAYLNHNSKEHGIERDGKFKCFGCGKLHNHKKTRMCHEHYHCKGLEYGFKCNICGRYLPLRGLYERHLNYHRLNKVMDMPEDSGGIFKCDKCNERFARRSEWYSHKVKQHGPKKKYICETCGKVFSRPDYLSKHVAIHTGTKRYKCDVCDYQSIQQSNIIIHMRKHTNERPYACDLCPQRCVSISNLHAHRRRHLGLNKFQCSICNKKFGYKESLRDHISVKHQRSQANTCQICGAEYALRSGLRRHIRKKHPELTQKPNNDSDRNIPEKHQNTSEILYPLNNGDKNGEDVLYPNDDGDRNGHGVLYPNNDGEKNGQGVLYPNNDGDKNGQGVLYPNNDGDKNGQRVLYPNNDGDINGQRVLYPNNNGDKNGQRVLYPNNNEDKNGQRVLYPNNDGDKNRQEVVYSNVSKDYEMRNSNLNIPLSLNNENKSLVEGQEVFDLKIGENNKFVCFEKSFRTKEGENIVIVLQEQE